MNRTLIADERAVVRNRVLLSGSLGYRAFVVNNTPNVNYETPLDLQSVRKLLSWAQAGLPLVIVGETPDRVRGYAPAEDALLRKTLQKLTRLRNVANVETEGQVAGALRRFDVEPAADYATSTEFLNIRRQTADSNYYYLWNLTGKRADLTVELAGDGDPYRYDPWTGKVERIAEFTRTRKGIRVTVSAARADGVLIAVTRGNQDTRKLGTSGVHVVSTTAEIATVDADGVLAVQSVTGGKVVTTLSNGRKVTSTIATVPAPSTLTDWKLSVTSYTAGATPSLTTRTALDPITLTANEAGVLPDWQAIGGLGKVSGESSYTTTVDIPAALLPKGGARLDLGKVLGTYRVAVNGVGLPTFDLMDGSAVDLTPALRAGRNTVVVTVNTLLGNAAFGSSQPYGLVGPVALQPYGSATVWRR